MITQNEHGKRNRQEFICNICGSRETSRSEHRSDGVTVLFCADCDMGVIHPIPDDLSHFYEGDYYNGGKASKDGYSDYETMAEHGVSWAAAIVDAIGKSGDILDIGCADGYLLRRLQLPMRLSGIEVNEEAAAKAREAGVDVISDDLFDDEMLAKFASHFDVVMSIATFEHLKDFKGGIEAALSLAKEGGYLLFEVPLMSEVNDNSVWLNSSLEHVYYPTVRAMEYLFTSVPDFTLLGAEIEVQGYASTYVGLVARDVSPLVGTWEEIVSIEGAGTSSQTGRAKALLRVIHSAHRSPNDIALLAHLRNEEVTKPLVSRIRALWQSDASRLEALERERIDANAERATLVGKFERTILDLTSAYASERIDAERADLAEGFQRGVSELSDGYLGELLRRGQLVATLDSDLAQSQRDLAQRDATIELLRAKDVTLEKTIHRNAVLLREAESRVRAALEELENAKEHRRYAASLEKARDWHAAESSKWARLYEQAAKKPGAHGSPRPLLPRLRRGFSHPLRAGKALVAKMGAPFGRPKEPSVAKARIKGSSVKEQPVIKEIEVAALPADVPLVSIVIPCFNYGKYVSEAVASAKRQTFARIEILVVEGGSTDGTTPAIVAGLEQPGVRIFQRESRHRAGSNRNFGIEHARGKYICCLDADDLLDPTYIEKAVFLLESYGYDVVSPAVQIFGAMSKRYGVAKNVDLGSLLVRNEITTCAVFRRALWEKVGGYGDYGDGSAATHIHEDWELWVRFAAAGAKFHNMHSDHLFMYRTHASESLSNREGVGPRAEQAMAIRTMNADVITPEALKRSTRVRETEFEATNALANLIPQASMAPSGRSILIALPWMVLGGAERLLSKIVGHLVAEGWQATIVTTNQSNPQDGDTSAWFESSTAQIFHLPRFLDSGRWSKFLDYLILSRRVTHLLIAGSAFVYDQLPQLRARFADLATCDLLFNTVGHTKRNRGFADHIDLNIVENAEVRDWLLANGEVNERIVTIPSGIELSHSVQPPEISLRSKLGIDKDELIVGFSGRWSPEKNPLGFVWIAELLAINRRISFVMTGTGGMGAQVEAALRESPFLAGRFHLMGNVEDLASVLPEYDVLVIPSKEDGRPVVALEALALGVPVVASRVGGLPELIVPGETGELCDPDDLLAFADAIESLERDRQKLARYKRAARRFARDNLDVNMMLESYDQVLREVRPRGVPREVQRPSKASA
jgi:glycosyltransferase involved in cell wall biosynthesis/SAM-dependent methyltransferase